MHGTLEMQRKKIVIKDSSDHNMYTPSFKIEATTKGLLDHAESIEDKNLKEKFTFNDFINELNKATFNYEIDKNKWDDSQII